MKKTFAVILFLFITWVSHSQRKVTFSVKPSYSFTMVTRTLEANMDISGFGDEGSAGLSPNTSYPQPHPKTIRSGLGFITELEIKAHKKFSFSLTGGLPDIGEVDGYDQLAVNGTTGTGNFLFLKYSTWVISPALNYRYSSHKTSLGPAVAVFRYKQLHAGPQAAVNETKWMGGFSLSHSFFPLKKEKVKIGCFAQASLFPDIITKEIRVHAKPGYPGSTDGVLTSTYQAAWINVSHILVGLVFEY